MKQVILAAFLLIAVAAAGATAQNRTGKANPLDGRGGLPIPQNLQDMKNLSLSLWIKFRATNQRYYRFVNEAAEFHAYSDLCKRHDLNISMDKITTVAHRFIEATIPAHYDDAEFVILDSLSKDELRAFTSDMSSDVYAFEYGYRLATLTQTIKKSRKSKKEFCKVNADRYKGSYFGLFASARRALDED
ncbi:MAG: hypothetical protein COB37_00815 [Kordiimonadales bacterium]|nr:MAG: hypothetical protein COB37_00815 [Kordiimonadales bacterium]